MDERQFEVASQDRGLNVYHFMLKHLPEIDRGFVRSILETSVFVNGEAAEQRRRLVFGDVVTVNLPEDYRPRPKKLPEQAEILYEDDCLVIVNKPAGWLSSPEKGREGSVLESVREKTGCQEGLRVVHKLDKDTSGAVVVAKSRAVKDALTREFSEGSFKRSFWGFCGGHPIESSGTISMDIAPKHKGSGMRVVTHGGREAHTEWTVLRQYRGYAKVQATPNPGLTHQVRIHLAAIGLPVLCDSIYGGGEFVRLSDIKPRYRPKKGHAEPPIIDRLALHAESVELTNPESGERLSVSAPIPVALLRLEKALEKYSSP